MSKRIEKLAKKSGLLGRKFAFGQYWDDELTDEQKKFAELIIKECCAQFKDNPYVGAKRTQYIYGYIQGRTDAEIKIKEHFGVEK